MMRLVTDDAVEMGPIAFDAEPAIDNAEAENFPGEAEMILSAMDAASADRTPTDRRVGSRRSQRGQADLRLFAHAADAPPTLLFTRDISTRGVGFITQNRLPLGYSGLVRITREDGHVVTAACSVYRCRPAINGWYEGALHFTNRQPDLG